MTFTAPSGEALEVVEWWLHEIPVVPMGFDEWHNEWDDWKEPIPYLLHLHYSRCAEGSTLSDDDFDDLYPELWAELDGRKCFPVSELVSTNMALQHLLC